MKFAYISVVISSPKLPTPHDLLSIDASLKSLSRAHEIIVVTTFSQTQGWRGISDLHCPLSVVRVEPSASPDRATTAGLARAAGDFILEWRGSPTELTRAVISQLIEPTNHGCELVEAIVSRDGNSFIDMIYALANAFRPWSQPVKRTVARLYSRNAIGSLLTAASVEPILAVLASELSVKRETVGIKSEDRPSSVRRRQFWEALSLLSKGTKLGSVLPLVLALLFGAFGAIAAIYAVLIITIRGRAPEGWTTLMVLTGLGQASLLFMVGLTWSRIDALTRGLAQKPDVTTSVEIYGTTATVETSAKSGAMKFSVSDYRSRPSRFFRTE
jgi:hypothetical protein